MQSLTPPLSFSSRTLQPAAGQSSESIASTWKRLFCLSLLNLSNYSTLFPFSQRGSSLARDNKRMFTKARLENVIHIILLFCCTFGNLPPRRELHGNVFQNKWSSTTTKVLYLPHSRKVGAQTWSTWKSLSDTAFIVSLIFLGPFLNVKWKLRKSLTGILNHHNGIRFCSLFIWPFFMCLLNYKFCSSLDLPVQLTSHSFRQQKCKRQARISIFGRL